MVLNNIQRTLCVSHIWGTSCGPRGKTTCPRLTWSRLSYGHSCGWLCPGRTWLATPVAVGGRGRGGNLREAVGRVSGWWDGLEAAAKEASGPCPLPLTLTSWKEIPHCIWGSPILAVHRKCPFLPERQKASTDGLDVSRQVCGRSPREANPDFSRHGSSFGKFSDNGHCWLAALEWEPPTRPSSWSSSDCTPPHSFARGSWEDKCRGQNHSSFLTNPLVLNPDVLPVKWASPFVSWMSP